MAYFKINNLFSNKEFGFIKGCSTTLQLLEILDRWTELLENGGQIDVVYTDLEKAFDKIPLKRLINKLFSYGINKKIIAWIEAFLNNRQEAQLMLTTGSTRLAVSRGQQTWYHFGSIATFR